MWELFSVLFSFDLRNHWLQTSVMSVTAAVCHNLLSFCYLLLCTERIQCMRKGVVVTIRSQVLSPNFDDTWYWLCAQNSVILIHICPLFHGHTEKFNVTVTCIRGWGVRFESWPSYRLSWLSLFRGFSQSRRSNRPRPVPSQFLVHGQLPFDTRLCNLHSWESVIQQSKKLRTFLYHSKLYKLCIWK